MPGGGLLAPALGLGGFLLLWHLVHVDVGALVLPSPLAVARRVLALAVAPGTPEALARTAADALGGLAAGGLAGLLLGVASGALPPLGAALRPVVTVILGVPHIAWVVLALLWFGPQGLAPGVTVALACLPVLFAGGYHGARARDPDLTEMARVFALGPWQRATELALPQLLVHLAPAFATALGLAFKVAVMAEVLSGGAGVGGQVATARAYLETDLVLAWIVLVVVLLLALDAMLARLLAPGGRRRC
ncbi:Hydroxymethylpyrimidine ABC transporter, transmembrane component [Rhodovastum atsumiense]|uniref:ABC transporter permease n=1 Tax=Rhodovastum atsumiense TaxID=504468 RepID=UPI00139F2B0F|nr:ABC transporter permease subunit [Rhodovastum atsumiense]CAH2603267.1 Hydroxymethylpyrimidine ABC transporter, transmembrane component [Rhodovastum atsumiense]